MFNSIVGYISGTWHCSSGCTPIFLMARLRRGLSAFKWGVFKNRRSASIVELRSSIFRRYLNMFHFAASMSNRIFTTKSNNGAFVYTGVVLESLRFTRQNRDLTVVPCEPPAKCWRLEVDTLSRCQSLRVFDLALTRSAIQY